MPSVSRGGPRPLPCPPLSPGIQKNYVEFGASTTISVEFLMPNSILIHYDVSPQASLSELKQELWERAAEYPLFYLLHDQTKYHFACVNLQSGVTELLDESKCLQEVSPFLNILKVIERKGNEAEKLLNGQIGYLIGKDLQKFDDLKSPEVNDFRWRMKMVCDEVVTKRNQQTWIEQMQYRYACRLAPEPTLPSFILSRLVDGQLLIAVHFDDSTALPHQRYESTFTLRVDRETHPKEVVLMALYKRFNAVEGDRQREVAEDSDNFVLKAVGLEEYLFMDVPLSQYIYVQQQLNEEEIQQIHMVVVHKQNIPVDVDSIYGHIGDCGMKHLRSSFSNMTLTKKKNLNYISPWSIDENFHFHIKKVTQINLPDLEAEIKIEAGLYHGGEELCKTQLTQEVNVQNGTAVVEQRLTFDITVCNVPRNTRLCLAIYEVKGSKGRPSNGDLRQDWLPLAWVNTSVYDYRNQLKAGGMTLTTWSATVDMQSDVEMPNPLGTVVNRSDREEAVTMAIIFPRYDPTGAVLYPTRESIMKLVREIPICDNFQPSEAEKEDVKKVADRDPLMELHKQEMDLLWSARWHCLANVAHALPKLLKSVRWDQKEQVAEMISLLEKWPKLAANRALELLDYAYAEPTVRSYAIDCLNSISDDDLLLYLLQLVQALKHENFLYCELVEFLISRALRNMRIGHFFFWHLRSEMHMPSVAIRFGLILEAYCRGSVEHMRILMKQLEAMNKFKEVRSIVRENRMLRETAERHMKEYLATPLSRTALSDFINPIDPMCRIKQIKLEECKFKDSKMAPLWMVFQNSDPYGHDVYLLYKSGDDLRQDMLTLQMIRIMDKLWKDNGLDLRMNPYTCMSMDDREGIIQVVLNAETIANIQRKKGTFSATCAFRKGSLLDWLKDHNPTETSLTRAIHEFTLSCAGYCVATYVLGIADRHSDNIMIMRTGQLFHIDFGHILGHFKEKLGIKRERQPFVLTHDFIHVITKGTKGEAKSLEFQNFQDYCLKAFCILRQHGSLIISLFAMMISTGLPELQSEKDLNYLKDTLKLDLSEEEALEHFRSKFNEALRNAWKTSVNWAFHTISKNNR